MKTTELELLYRDDWLVAVNKPSGIMIHRTKQSSDNTYLLQLLRDQIGQKIYPVHRLDRPTSGVILFALDSKTAAALCNDFRYNRINKEYITLVRGYVDEKGSICKLVKAKGIKKSSAREGQTDYQRLKTVEIPIPVGRYESSRYSLVKVFPKTGRKHQIRLHFSSINHPVIGDVNYGDGKHNKMFREQFNNHRLILMAEKINFCHPQSGKSLSIKAPLDPEMVKIFELLFGD